MGDKEVAEEEDERKLVEMVKEEATDKISRLAMNYFIKQYNGNNTIKKTKYSHCADNPHHQQEQ